jgi:tetratricopeptide (TPR) repeat protein
VHLSALAHLNPNTPIEQDQYKILIDDFELLKIKINFILEEELKINSELTDREIADKFQKIGPASHLKRFAGCNYVKLLIEELIKSLSAVPLEKLDFNQREDRYYLGRTLSIVGELSKQLREFVNPEKEGGLFAFFKKIRDKKLAHSRSALIKNINADHSKYFDLLIGLTEQFKAHVNQLAKDVKGFDPRNGKDLKIKLGTTTEKEKQELNKLIDSIFGKKIIEIDEAVLKEIGKGLEVSLIQVETNQRKSLENREPQETRNIINTLEQIKRKLIPYNKLMSGSVKLKNKAVVIKKEILELIELYNSSLDMDVSFKFSDPERIPTKEELDLLAEQIIIAGLEKAELLKQKKIAEKIKIDLPHETKVPIDTKIHLEKVRTNVAKSLTLISKELLFMADVFKNTLILEEKKTYIIAFSLTKIGQIFVDSNKERSQIAANLPKAHRKSVKKVTSARHQLMHDLFSCKKGDISNVLFRDALPMLSEINALKMILEKDLSGTEGLISLGKAYTELKDYAKAMECFDGMLTISQNHLLTMDEKVKKEDVEHYDYALNALFAMGEVYGKAAIDSSFTDTSYELYQLKIRSLEQCLDLIEQMDNLEKPSFFAGPIATCYHNLGNTYICLNDYKEAIKYFKKAFKVLINDKQHDPAKEALYLFNIGNTYYSYSMKEHLKGFEIDVSFSGAVRHMQLAAICFSEAKEICEKIASDEKRISSFYINLNIRLIQALVFDHEENHPLAFEIYEHLVSSLQNFPIRENDQRMEIIKSLAELKELFEHKISVKNKKEFKEKRSTYDARYQLYICEGLAALYHELELPQQNLKNRMKAIEEGGKRNGIQQELALYRDISELNNQGCLLFDEGKLELALQCFLLAEKALTTKHQNYIKVIYGSLLESIGDVYYNMKNNELAKTYYFQSLEMYCKYQPNDKTFKLPCKIMLSCKETEYQKFFKIAVDMLIQKVGMEDPRMNEIMEIYNLNSLSTYDEDTILLNKIEKMKELPKFLIIPNGTVANGKKFEEYCEKFLGAKCQITKDSYKIFLSQKGKEHLENLKKKNLK